MGGHPGEAHEDRGAAVEEPESGHARPAKMMPSETTCIGPDCAADKIQNHVDRVGATGRLRRQAQHRALVAVHGSLDADIQLWSASPMLLSTLQETFIGRAANRADEDNARDVERWRRRYLTARSALSQAGIPLTSDEQAGADLYIELRGRWDHLIRTLAPTMGYSMDEVDPAGQGCGQYDRIYLLRARMPAL
jgi:hypothetical protein